MRDFVRLRPLRAFIVLAYGVSWACWLPLILRDARVVPGGSVTHFPGLPGPAVAAFLVTSLAEGGPGVRSLAKRLIQVPRPFGVSFSTA